jgi:hypothetical protein
MLEFEHQAEHWDTPEHAETGHLVAEALRAAVEIARGGGLRCEHRLDIFSQHPFEPASARSRPRGSAWKR